MHLGDPCIHCGAAHDDVQPGPCATGKNRGPYGNLQREYFGTKDYDRWHGQASGHDYGSGPNHGSIIFSIGLHPEARKRDLSEAEKEACVYYLLNLTAIQKTQAAAKFPA